MPHNKKIVSFDELVSKAKALQKEGKRIVYCHGVFDLLHIGHIRYFNNSAKQGDVLIVTLTPDRFVDKGLMRPAFNQDHRSEAVASMDIVDWVAINPWPTAEQSLRTLKPHVYSKGAEFFNPKDDPSGKMQLELNVLDEIGGEMFFSDDVTFSSSNLINRFFSGFSDEVKEFLSLFRKRWSPEYILGILEKLGTLRVLVVGDTILDEYQYCSALGKSSKDPVLAAHFLSRDMFAGGALAVANHVSNFAGQTTLATVLAKDCPYSDFVRKGLNENIKKSIHLRDSSVTTLKRRFIDDQSLVKMFEIYEMDNAPMPQELESSVCSELEDLIPKADLVLVADFGHGTITPTMRKLICEKARYLAVNTQANAGNRGYHTISLYPRADCVVLAEHEARLACQDLYSELRPLTQRIQRRLNCRHVVVTRGRKGVALMSDTGEFTQVPAFIAEQVDSVGSGDALLSVLSQCACLDLPQQVMGLIGNAAGALTVKFVGNSQSVGKQQLKKFLLAQLK